MSRILVVAILLASALYGLRESGALDRAGMLGSCQTVESAPAEHGEWLACRGGRFSGSPDLTRDSCQKGATLQGVTYWYCPERLVADHRSDLGSPPP